jgi:hypothetical protein
VLGLGVRELDSFAAQGLLNALAHVGRALHLCTAGVEGPWAIL